MRGCRRRLRGVFILEALCGLVVIGVTLYAVSMLLVSYQRMQEYMVTHRRVQLAAEGQMERYRSGEALPEGTDSLDGPEGIQLHIEREPGEGDWKGLWHVRITATAIARHGQQVTYRLSAYVRAGDDADAVTTGKPTPNVASDVERVGP